MGNFGDLREEYDSSPLSLGDMDRDPMSQFRLWLAMALKGGVREPNAMVLSTSSREGVPSSRTILIKEAREEGFTFFTNYSSRKSLEILSNPWVSLTTYWREIYSQVSVEGRAEKLAEEESVRYFETRPRDAKIGAWCSPQGRELSSRGELERAFSLYSERFSGERVIKPPHWGGFIVRPYQFIFWRGRRHRLHDRFLYRKEGGEWRVTRIAP